MGIGALLKVVFIGVKKSVGVVSSDLSITEACECTRAVPNMADLKDCIKVDFEESTLNSETGEIEFEKRDEEFEIL